MKINNRKIILLQYFLWVSVLFIATYLLYYFDCGWPYIVFAFTTILYCSIRFFNAKYFEIRMYQDHIAIKEYSIAGKVPLRFSPIAYSDITSFYFDPEKNTMVFRTEFESIIKYADFSTKYFTKKQKSDLKKALNQYIV